MIDPSKEPYGFLLEPVDLNQPVEDLLIPIVQADVNKFSLQSGQPQGPWFELSFSKPVVRYKLALLQQPKRFKQSHLYSHWVEKGNVVRVYNTLGLLEEDNLDAILQAEDAMGHILEDTVSIHFREGKTSKEEFKYSLTPPTGTKIPLVFEGYIAASKPIKKLQPDHIFFIVNSKDTIHVSMEDLRISEHEDSITIKKQFGPDLLRLAGKGNTPDSTQQGISLLLTQGAFLSVEQEPSQANNYAYTFKNPQECGIIKGKITTQAPGFIIQLLNEKYEVVQEIRNQPNYEFRELLPGTYRIRVLSLQAKDATWQYGDIYQLKPPDPVILYPHELPIVANWELDYIDLEF